MGKEFGLIERRSFWKKIAVNKIIQYLTFLEWLNDWKFVIFYIFYIPFLLAAIVQLSCKFYYNLVKI